MTTIPKGSRRIGHSVDRYKVHWVPIDSIQPSPENDDIYGEIEHDAAMSGLIASIEAKGIEEPILVTLDDFILSGHRRYYACEYLGWDSVPVSYRNIRREGHPRFHAELTQYNPQRIKSVGAVLKEAMLRDNDPEDTYAAIEEQQEASLHVDAEFMVVQGAKSVDAISDRRMEFLKAVQKVIENMRRYWPLSIRQIHYKLLNKPPLKQTPKRSKFSPDKYRYKNDQSSYDSLVDLLTSARYHGQISMTAIDDPTRPVKTYRGYTSVADFIQNEISGFLTGFHRSKQQGQERHIEVFAEKNTLYRIVERACQPYYVPFSIGRGFSSIPVWRDMARRFRTSGCKAMTLIIVSDYDPEGLELADDAVRSLALHGIQVDGHRVAVTREQIDELGLAGDFNPAKESSSRYTSFVDRTGGTETWEVEALPPDFLLAQIKAAIEANMDMDVYERVCQQEREDCSQLCAIRKEIASSMEF